MEHHAFRELGLPHGSSEAEIKAAYRKLALQCHPDRHLNSSPKDAAAAAHRFKAITEAYDYLTNPNERLRSSYGASSSSPARSSSSRGSSSSSRAYHYYNVNTDWSHYDPSSSGYTSRISRWEWWKRAARVGMRSFGHSLHLSLAVVLIGGGLLFESTHSAMWQARNKGKSFEEVQAAVRARKRAAAEAAAAGTDNGGSSGGGDSNSSSPSSSSTSTAGVQVSNPVAQQKKKQQQPQGPVFHIRSSWADGMRGRFVEASEADSIPNEPRVGPPNRDG